MSQLFVMAAPIPNGKEQEWHQFMNEVKSLHFEEHKALHQRLGIRERTYYQQTTMGGMVIVTFEGENPQQAFQQFVQGQDEYTKWFLSRVSAIHEIDFTQPLPSPISQLVLDSSEVMEPASA